MKEQQRSAETSVHSNPVTQGHIRVRLNRLQNRYVKLKYRQRGTVMFCRFRYICGGQEGVEVRHHSFFTSKLGLCGRLHAPPLPTPRNKPRIPFGSVGRDISVGIAIRYGLDGPGIESRWGQDFPHPSKTGPGAHLTSCSVGTGSFLGVKRSGRGVDRPPHLAPKLKKG